jgi:hypothetical protein
MPAVLAIAQAPEDPRTARESAGMWTTSSQQFVERPSLTATMLFERFLREPLQEVGLFAKTAGPGFLVIERFQDLRGDGILFVGRERRNAPKGFLKQAGHILTIPHQT